jgi:hypothetical protein
MAKKKKETLTMASRISLMNEKSILDIGNLSKE